MQRYGNELPNELFKVWKNALLQQKEVQIDVWGGDINYLYDNKMMMTTQENVFESGLIAW